MFEARQIIVTGLTGRPQYVIRFLMFCTFDTSELSPCSIQSVGSGGMLPVERKACTKQAWRRLVTGNEERRRSEMNASPRPGLERVDSLGHASHTSSQRPNQRHWRCRDADQWSECSSDDERVVCHVVSGLGCSLVELTSM